MRIITNTSEGARSVGPNIIEATSDRWTTKASATAQAKRLVELEGGEACLLMDKSKSERSNRQVKRYIGGRITNRPERQTP